MHVFHSMRTRDSEAIFGGLARYGFNQATIAALRDAIAQAADYELYQANPRALAERLGRDEHPTLTLLVAAVAEGMFTLDWHVTCPHCQQPGRTAPTLDRLAPVDQCPHCGHTFDARLDAEISVTVSVTEAIRRLHPARRDDPGYRASVNARLGPMPALALINIPPFRELVTSQILPEGQSLGVRRLAIFFSDLRGSTALYHRLGDTAAYELVCRHFRAIFTAVAQQHGTAVKTIGDGVMGVFAEPAAALRGIAAARAALDQINVEAGLAGEDRLVLKVGLHSGPCIVVTLNGRLDYFGETVNIAARLSELAHGDDVIASQAILDDPAARAFTAERGALLPLAAQLRGLPDRFDLYRLDSTSPENQR
jgi:class 3 adenylate cyclase